MDIDSWKLVKSRSARTARIEMSASVELPTVGQVVAVRKDRED